MPSLLGRKQSLNQETWLAALERIEETVPRAQLDALVERTVADIRRTVQGKNVAFAWSGGKDSLVLEQVCYQAGVDECMMALSDLEYPAFLQWVTDHMPPAVELVFQPYDLAWLAGNQHLLFPQDAKTAAHWFKIIQHTAQAKYYQEHTLDLIILGRRRMDGNYTGVGGLYTNKEGVTRYSPLMDWSHEDVLAFLHYFQVDIPPIYGWPNGYRVGTGPWPARQWTSSIEQGWREVYTIDPAIVEEASTLLPSARQFLQTRGGA